MLTNPEDAQWLDLAKRLLEAETQEEFRERLDAVIATIPQDDRAEAERKLAAKDVPRRFTEHVEVLNELMATGKVLVAGLTYEERYQQFLRLVGHVERTWKAGVTLLRSGNCPGALFFALLTLEETGKVALARFQLLITEDQLRTLREKARSARPFYIHRRKHLLAAGAGALINSRLDRILGEDTVSQFLTDVESGSIESLRQTALYADHDGRKLQLPEDAIHRHTALHYIVLSGEAMVEVLGWHPDEFARLLGMTKQVELEFGLSAE